MGEPGRIEFMEPRAFAVPDMYPVIIRYFGDGSLQAIVYQMESVALVIEKLSEDDSYRLSFMTATTESGYSRHPKARAYIEKFGVAPVDDHAIQCEGILHPRADTFVLTAPDDGQTAFAHHHIPNLAYLIDRTGHLVARTSTNGLVTLERHPGPDDWGQPAPKQAPHDGSSTKISAQIAV